VGGAAPPPRSWVTGRAEGCNVPKKRQRLCLRLKTAGQVARLSEIEEGWGF
jgi:hypothetical protein